MLLAVWERFQDRRKQPSLTLHRLQGDTVGSRVLMFFMEKLGSLLDLMEDRARWRDRQKQRS